MGVTVVKRGPIFIVGAPRSGTSLLRNILNRHPAIGLCDETYFDYYVYSRRAAFGDLADLTHRRRLISRYLAITRIGRLGIDLDGLAAALLREGVTYAAFFATLLRFYAEAKGKVRWGEKTPQHASLAPALCEWFPDCTVIHIVRDPRDVVSSLLQMPWGSRNALTNARLWARCVRAAERCRNADNFLRVSYECLVADPKSELHRICAFIGEADDAAMLTPEAGQGRLSDRWWFARAHGAVAADRIATWRSELTADAVREVEDVAFPLAEEFGYRRTAAPLSRVQRGHARLVEGLMAARSIPRQLPRIWYHWIRPTQLAAEESWIDQRQ